MEKISRDNLIMIEGGSLWQNIAGIIINSIYLVTSVFKLVRRRG